MGELYKDVYSKIKAIKDSMVKILLVSIGLTFLVVILQEMGMCPDFISSAIEDYITSNIDQLPLLIYGFLFLVIVYIVMTILIVIFAVITGIFSSFGKLLEEFRIKKAAGFPVPLPVKIFRIIAFWIYAPIIYVVVGIWFLISLPFRAHKEKKQKKLAAKQAKQQAKIQKRQQEEVRENIMAAQYRKEMLKQGKKPRK